MRALILSAGAIALLSGSTAAFATSAQKPAPVPAAEFEMPSKAEMEAAIDALPDLNALLGDMMTLVHDERLQERMEKSGEAFAKRLDKSGALEPDANGIPDIKLALKALMGAMTDEDVTGGLLDTITDMQQIMEKHIPEERADASKPE